VAEKRRVVGGADATPLSTAEHALFERLRKLRRQLATERHVPPYLVFGDAALEEMARRRPGSKEAFLAVRGVGQAKVEQFGDAFVDAIRDGAEELGLPLRGR
jgi:ATP-dependent DNA helicase RecQ